MNNSLREEEGIRAKEVKRGKSLLYSLFLFCTISSALGLGRALILPPGIASLEKINEMWKNSSYPGTNVCYEYYETGFSEFRKKPRKPRPGLITIINNEILFNLSGWKIMNNYLLFFRKQFDKTGLILLHLINNLN